ncbi:MAG: TonB-dependent receptor [bacterium]|nr:TonB-dependent receptor [bacterium]
MPDSADYKIPRNMAKLFAVEDGAIYSKLAIKHKVNIGFNLKTFNKKLNINVRANIVGKRLAQATNNWLNTYAGGYGPSYIKINSVVTYRLSRKLDVQLVVKNMLDEDYYGISRGPGASFIENYDPVTTPNPPGYVPPYHPQPGRTIMLSLRYK